jgi:Zn-dependent protease
MQWWVHSAYQDGGVVLLFSWAFWVLFSIVLHELSHGWAAIANGDETPREMGHLTLNPVVHMGWMSLAFFAVAGFAWGLMPTMPHRYRHERRGRVLVALAGPAMNALLAFVTLTAAGAWASAIRTGRIAPAEHTAANVAEFLFIGGFINLILGVFNMLPVPPLDGSAVLAGASRTLDRFFSLPQVRMYGMLVMLLVFFQALDAPLQRAMGQAATNYMVWVEERLSGTMPEGPDQIGVPTIGDPDADNTMPDAAPSRR